MAGVPLPKELETARRSTLQGYVQECILRDKDIFVSALAKRISEQHPEIRPEDVKQCAKEVTKYLQSASQRSRRESRLYGGLKLEFTHTCQVSACSNHACALCRHNPRRRCSNVFQREYLATEDVKSACGASVFLRLVDAFTGIAQPDLPELDVQLFLVPANRLAARVSEADSSMLQASNEVPGVTLSNSDEIAVGGDGSVKIKLKNGCAELMGLRVADHSCDMMMMDSAPRVALCGKAVAPDGPVKCEPALSNSFMVLYGESKSPVVHLHDSVGVLRIINEERAEKLQQIHLLLGTVAAEAGMRHGVKTVGELKLLMAAAHNQFDDQLMTLLQLTPEEWEELKEETACAVVVDNRSRVWYADGNKDAGLLFACRDGMVDFAQSPGFIMYDSTGTPSVETKLNPELQQEIDELAQVARQQWQQEGHPGWEVLPSQAEFALQGTPFAAPISQQATSAGLKNTNHLQVSTIIPGQESPHISPRISQASIDQGQVSPANSTSQGMAMSGLQQPRLIGSSIPIPKRPALSADPLVPGKQSTWGSCASGDHMSVANLAVSTPPLSQSPTSHMSDPVNTRAGSFPHSPTTLSDPAAMVNAQVLNSGIGTLRAYSVSPPGSKMQVTSRGYTSKVKPGTLAEAATRATHNTGQGTSSNSAFRGGPSVQDDRSPRPGSARLSHDHGMGQSTGVSQQGLMPFNAGLPGSGASGMGLDGVQGPDLLAGSGSGDKLGSESSGGFSTLPDFSTGGFASGLLGSGLLGSGILSAGTLTAHRADANNAGGAGVAVSGGLPAVTDMRAAPMDTGPSTMTTGSHSSMQGPSTMEHSETPADNTGTGQAGADGRTGIHNNVVTTAADSLSAWTPRTRSPHSVITSQPVLLQNQNKVSKTNPAAQQRGQPKSSAIWQKLVGLSTAQRQGSGSLLTQGSGGGHTPTVGQLISMQAGGPYGHSGRKDSVQQDGLTTNYTKSVPGRRSSLATNADGGHEGGLRPTQSDPPTYIIGGMHDHMTSLQTGGAQMGSSLGGMGMSTPLQPASNASSMPLPATPFLSMESMHWHQHLSDVSATPSAPAIFTAACKFSAAAGRQGRQRRHSRGSSRGGGSAGSAMEFTHSAPTPGTSELGKRGRPGMLGGDALDCGTMQDGALDDGPMGFTTEGGARDRGAVRAVMDTSRMAYVTDADAASLSGVSNPVGGLQQTTSSHGALLPSLHAMMSDPNRAAAAAAAVQPATSMYPEMANVFAQQQIDPSLQGQYLQHVHHMQHHQQNPFVAHNQQHAVPLPQLHSAPQPSTTQLRHTFSGGQQHSGGHHTADPLTHQTSQSDGHTPYAQETTQLHHSVMTANLTHPSSSMTQQHSDGHTSHVSTHPVSSAPHSHSVHASVATSSPQVMTASPLNPLPTQGLLPMPSPPTQDAPHETKHGASLSSSPMADPNVPRTLTSDDPGNVSFSAWSRRFADMSNPPLFDNAELGDMVEDDGPPLPGAVSQELLALARQHLGIGVENLMLGAAHGGLVNPMLTRQQHDGSVAGANMNHEENTIDLSVRDAANSKNVLGSQHMHADGKGPSGGQDVPTLDANALSSASGLTSSGASLTDTLGAHPMAASLLTSADVSVFHLERDARMPPPNNMHPPATIPRDSTTRSHSTAQGTQQPGAITHRSPAPESQTYPRPAQQPDPIAGVARRDGMASPDGIAAVSVFEEVQLDFESFGAGTLSRGMLEAMSMEMIDGMPSVDLQSSLGVLSGLTDLPPGIGEQPRLSSMEITSSLSSLSLELKPKYSRQ